MVDAINSSSSDKHSSLIQNEVTGQVSPPRTRAQRIALARSHHSHMTVFWTVLPVSLLLQKMVWEDYSLNPFVDLYLRSVFFFIFVLIDFTYNVYHTDPSLSLFDCPQELRWLYTVKALAVCCFFSLLALSVANAGCLALSIAPLLVAPVLIQN